MSKISEIAFKEIFLNMKRKLKSSMFPKRLHNNLATLLVVYKLNGKNFKYLKKFFNFKSEKLFNSLIEVLYNINIGIYVIENKDLFNSLKEKRNIIKKLIKNSVSKNYKEKEIIKNFNLFMQPILEAL